MRAEIITIGDEILVGQTIDTNSAWIASTLREIGISIQRITSISDTSEAITTTLEEVKEKADLVILTGGLGPTKDDITKQVLTEYFKDHLVLYSEIESDIRNYFESANRPYLEVNKWQAMLPSKAKIIRNDLGTASGMWFVEKNKHFISLPGVPYEMKALLEKIIPELKSEFSLANLYHKTIHLQGIPESILANEISDLENEIRSKNITVSYLPSTGLIKVRLTGKLNQEKEIDTYLSLISSKYPLQFFGTEDDTIESVVGKLLKENKQTLGSVESCSGGALAQRIVGVPGSSAYYKGSIVSYAYEAKENLVDIDANLLWTKGAVSKEVVEQMALNGRIKLNVDYCIATSGIAGPDGGTAEKPVGTIWVAVSTKECVYSKKFQFRQNRERNIESTVVYGLNFLRRIILGIQPEN